MFSTTRPSASSTTHGGEVSSILTLCCKSSLGTQRAHSSKPSSIGTPQRAHQRILRSYRYQVEASRHSPVLLIGAGSCRARLVSRWSARSEARTCDLDGDLCAATGCPARGGTAWSDCAGAVTGQRYGLSHRPASAGQLTGVRRRARRASARAGRGRPPPHSPRLAHRSAALGRHGGRLRHASPPMASRWLRPIWPGRAGRLARRRRALEPRRESCHNLKKSIERATRAGAHR